MIFKFFQVLGFLFKHLEGQIKDKAGFKYDLALCNYHCSQKGPQLPPSLQNVATARTRKFAAD